MIQKIDRAFINLIKVVMLISAFPILLFASALLGTFICGKASVCSLIDTLWSPKKGEA